MGTWSPRRERSDEQLLSHAHAHASIGAAATQDQIKNDLGGILIKNWAVFLPATVINIAYCPPELRVLFLNCVFFGALHRGTNAARLHLTSCAVAALWMPECCLVLCRCHFLLLTAVSLRDNGDGARRPPVTFFRLGRLPFAIPERRGGRMRRLPWEGFAVWGVVRRDRQWKKQSFVFMKKGSLPN